MADNPLVVALLKEYRDERSVSRIEAGRIIGMSRGTVAGICQRNNIAPWPRIKREWRKKRTCQFPIGHAGDADFHFCGKRLDPDHSLLCAQHRGLKWEPKAKVIPISNE